MTARSDARDGRARLGLCWGLAAVCLAAAPAGLVVRGERSFVTADVYEAALIASLFTLVFTGLLGVIRVLALMRRASPRA
ncbi:hypothetical protein LJR219_003833 [Phenylobacterium sp. LjRoot219]|uniref:hypothetical protein n=1 Tax=Phenylobacterium sp. LjRoot219 TaxID=3342283 RepID=UPI003ECEA731